MIWLVPTGPLGANDMRETNAKPTVSSQMLSSTAGPALPGLMPLAPRGPLGANRIISNAQLHRWSLLWGFNKKSTKMKEYKTKIKTLAPGSPPSELVTQQAIGPLASDSE